MQQYGVSPFSLSRWSYECLRKAHLCLKTWHQPFSLISRTHSRLWRNPFHCYSPSPTAWQAETEQSPLKPLEQGLCFSAVFYMKTWMEPRVRDTTLWSFCRKYIYFKYLIHLCHYRFKCNYIQNVKNVLALEIVRSFTSQLHFLLPVSCWRDSPAYLVLEMPQAKRENLSEVNEIPILESC